MMRKNVLTIPLSKLQPDANVYFWFGEGNIDLIDKLTISVLLSPVASLFSFFFIKGIFEYFFNVLL